jgi:nucleotide-binding universal stress UspA family protein
MTLRPIHDDVNYRHDQKRHRGDYMAGARIVVGVDDSPDAQWVLAWAIGEARIRRLPLLIVHVVPLPDTTPPAAIWAIATWGMGESLPTDAYHQERGTAVISELLENMTVPDDVEITTMSPMGEAGEILTSLARDGDLLVVGRSDRDILSRFTGRSVRRYCEWHSRAAMVTVSPPSGTRPDNPADMVRPRWWTKRPFRTVQAGIDGGVTTTRTES